MIRLLICLIVLMLPSPLFAAPFISAVNPNSGWQGDFVTVRGSGFAANPVVKFGPNIAPVMTVSSTLLTVKVPHGQPPGPARVTVDQSNALAFSTIPRSTVVLPPNPPRSLCPQQEEMHTSACRSQRTELGGLQGSVYSERGEFFQAVTDLIIPGRTGAELMLHYAFRRHYRAQVTTDTPLGHNWNHNYFEHLEFQPDRSVVHDNGLERRDHYVLNNKGEFIAPPELFTVLIHFPGGTWMLEHRGGTIHRFAADGKLLEIRDRNDNVMTFHYNASRQLIRVNDTLGRDIVYRYMQSGRLAEIEDWLGRKVTFTQDSAGDLIAVTPPAVTGTPTGNDFPSGKTTRYTYSSGFVDERLNHNLLTITRPNEVAAGGPPVLANVYGTDPSSVTLDRVIQQTYGGMNTSGVTAGGTFHYEYTTLNAGVISDDPNLAVGRTKETDRNGNVEEYEYNRLGYPLVRREFTRGLRASDPPVFETSKRYNADGQLVQTILPAGNQIRYEYDESSPDRLRHGNLLAETRLPDRRGGAQASLMTRYTYEPQFSHLATLTDARNHSTIFTYDSRGNLVRRQDPIVTLPFGAQEILTGFSYNAFGQLTSKTDPEGNVEELVYFPENDPDGDGNTSPGTRFGLDTTTGGYLRQRVTDAMTSPRRTESTPPVRISNQFFYDPVGNLIKSIDGRANDILYTVNQLNQVVRTQSASPSRYIKDSVYDSNDNIIETRIENQVPATTGGKPIFTGSGNFQSFRSTPEFLVNRMTYDILDQLVEKDEDATGGTPARLITRYHYDANQNQTQEIFPEGNLSRLCL